MVALVPGAPLIGMLAGLSENGPPTTLTPAVSEVALTLLIQPGPVTFKV